MPVEVSEDRVIIRFEIDEALELSDLTGSLTALESQYQRVLAIRGIDKKDINAKLYVTRLGSNSIEAEVAFWWLIARDVISAMDYTNIATDFTERLRRVIDRFSGKKLEDVKTKAPEINKDDLDDFEKFLKPIAGKKKAGLTIRRAIFQSKSGDREVLAE